MLFIKTDDGSLTYRNMQIDELYHTKAGAIVEAFEKHARALRVWEKQDPIIFDICSGLSYNAACAIDEIRVHGNTSKITIYLFENDIDVLKSNLELPDELVYQQDGKTRYVRSFGIIKRAIRAFMDHSQTAYEEDNIEINIMYGDFYCVIDSLSIAADYVFYAPFSPAFTPTMWTCEKFKKIHDHMKDGARLSTYSYARRVREALDCAGFEVSDGPVLGRRSPSLIATNRH